MERLKNMELKKTFLVLSASCVLGALLMLGLVFMICNSISSNFPSGGIEILADGSIVKMEPPTETQQNIFSMLGIIQIVSCIVLPMGGLTLSGILYYHIKLKQPISTLRNGISRIRNHDLDFSMPVHSDDELGQLCTAFDTMREELLKSNQELWRQAEERKRLNVAFSHDLRNPITVLKGTIKLLRQGTADEQAIDRLESYTLRIERYVEAMSSIQRLEQMPVRINEYSYSLLHSELEETAKILAGALEPSVSAPDKGTIQLDHGLVLTVAENLIGNAVRFAKSKIEIHLERKRKLLASISYRRWTRLSCGVNTKRPETVWKNERRLRTLWYGAIQQPDTMSEAWRNTYTGKQKKLWCNGYCFFPNKSETLSVF